MTRLLVVADDLSGACDTGVQFGKQGIATLVTTDVASVDVALQRPVPVLVVDTDSRHAQAATAAARVGSVVASAYSWGVRCFYKKIDSTLRGNIGAELDALTRAARERRVFVVPAFPGAGRTTIGGRQLVDGIPLEQTHLAHDPRWPMRESRLAAIVGQQSITPVQLFPVGCDERAVCAFATGMAVLDASTDAELRAVAGLLSRARAHCLAGSAGLAAHLPWMLGLEAQPRSALEPAQGCLLVNGSLSAVALKQVRRALADGVPGICIPPDAAVAPDPMPWARALALPKADGCVLLYTVLDTDAASAYRAAATRQGVSPERVHERVAGNLGLICAALARRMGVTAVGAFGGDTARGLIAALGCAGIMPAGEIEPGVAACRVEDATGTVLVVTKSGSLGGPDVVRHIERYLRHGGADQLPDSALATGGVPCDSP